jgi:fused signal recognition particle receptor
MAEFSQTLDGQLLLAAPVVVAVIVILSLITLGFIRRGKQLTDLAPEMELDLDGPKATVQPALKTTPPAETVEVSKESSPPPTPAVPTDIAEIRSSDDSSWLKRLRGGLSKTRESFQSTLGDLFSNKVKIDEDVLEELHEALFRADIGVKTSDKLVDHVRSTLGKEDAADWQQVSTEIKSFATELMESANNAELNRPKEGPWVILVVGVNGVGKTTSIGKLSAHFLAEGKSVLLAAADTYRAAAIDQIKVWGDRLGVDVIAHQPGSDPAAVAYDAVKAAKARNTDVLLIDTAGRLHSKNDLMKELEKIHKVIGKDLPDAPHEAWLVIDATTGQNAVQQVKAFKAVAKLSGLVVTKLDGTAKGGVLIGIADEFKMPIRYVGVGEKAVDLRTFKASEYVDSMF